MPWSFRFIQLDYYNQGKEGGGREGGREGRRDKEKMEKESEKRYGLRQV